VKKRAANEATVTLASFPLTAFPSTALFENVGTA
jgi:hypothetical protein